MDKETSEALEGSIRKWEGIVAGTGYDNGALNCPLCTAFWQDGCHDCPVMQKTGLDVCEETAYQEWFLHHKKLHGNTSRLVINEGCPECLRLAHAELDFLISLREPTDA